MRQPRTIRLETRLAAEDRARFEALASSKGLTKTELLREAALFYLNHQDDPRMDERESKLERRLKAIENRYASLIVRVGIDVGTIMAILASRIESPKRREIMDKAYSASVTRFRAKLEGVAKEMKENLVEMRNI